MVNNCNYRTKNPTQSCVQSCVLTAKYTTSKGREGKERKGRGSPGRYREIEGGKKGGGKGR